MGLCVCLSCIATAGTTERGLIRKMEQHAANKQNVLSLLKTTSQLEIAKRFSCDYRETWRRILIDGPYEGVEKEQFLETSLDSFTNSQQALPKALKSLLESHHQLFGLGRNRERMIRHAAQSAFTPFGVQISLAKAIATMSTGNDEPVQAFKTIFETGRNTRGYVHKLECHAEAVEYIYAVTDIVYGVMLPNDLHFGSDRVVAEPANVRLFYVKAGEVIALHPYVLHSGSLSVEPDGSFSIIIYKKPAKAEDYVVRLPNAWTDGQALIKRPDIDKYYLTLEELHTPELQDNKGFIASRRTVGCAIYGPPGSMRE